MNVRSTFVVAAVIGFGAMAALANAEDASNKAGSTNLTGAVTHVAKMGAKVCTDVGCVLDAVDEARKSNNKAKMHEALDMAYASLSSIRNDTNSEKLIAQRLQGRLEEIQTQMHKVHDEQLKLDNLFYTDTDQFIIH
jgi:hypothetical protein